MINKNKVLYVNVFYPFMLLTPSDAHQDVIMLFRNTKFKFHIYGYFLKGIFTSAFLT